MTAGTAGSVGRRPPGAFLRRCARWDAALASVETALLAILILGSLAASLVQIGLRNLGLPVLPETDTVVRRAVLWIAFLGASLAAFGGSHLAVDVADQVLPPRANRLVRSAAAVVAAVVTALLTIAAARFAAAELAFAGAGAAAGAAVMPLGFAVMTLRFLLAAARRLTGADSVPPDEAKRGRPTAGGPASRRLLRRGARRGIDSGASSRTRVSRSGRRDAATRAPALPPKGGPATGAARYRPGAIDPLDANGGGARRRGTAAAAAAGASNSLPLPLLGRLSRHPTRPAARVVLGMRNPTGGGI